MISASAPGRVNLIGEHAHLHAGFALPAPIAQRAYAELRRRDDDRVIVWSREMRSRAEYRLGDERRRRNWLDYIQGCTAAVRAAGHALGGIELHVASDVPLGGGLASSAALVIATLRALREAFALPIDDLALALLGMRAERELVGAPGARIDGGVSIDSSGSAGARRNAPATRCGVSIDRLVASVGEPGTALFVDVRDMVTRQLPLPPSDLLVIASGIAAGDDLRHAECETAARLLGVASLRDVTEADRPEIDALPPPLHRRVRHVVSENARVLAAVGAMLAGDLAALGTLIRASHRSMRDDYGVSVPAVDRLVAIAAADPDVVGARMTSGGSIVALAVSGQGARAARRIAAAYASETAQAPRVLLAQGVG